ncbi:MAG TPA: CDP-alcohol phosphatidyltransferase family protein [Polyangia bacterium]|jgi:phosphatidylglycerophosphate synthase|nr:CDP-alcohol phosphatidyltransferase family protein [Polyangia bacterium]
MTIASGEPATSAPSSYVVVTATHAEQPGASMRVAGLTVVERAIKQQSQTPHARVIVASDGTVVLPASLPANAEVQTVADAAAAASIASGLGATLVGGDVVRVARGDAGTRVTDESGRRAAEDAVFAALFRPDLGFVARRLNKPISVRFTRRILVATPITPNQITLVAAAFGLVGCALIAAGGYAAMVAGFACQHLQSVLDGCDGELARVRMQQSKLGAWLDTFVDDVLNVLITVAIGIGLYRSGAGAWAAAVGIAGGAMLVASNLIIMSDMRRQRASGDLMDMVWWFSGGKKLGAAAASTPDKKPGIGDILFAMGRRDSALLLWLVFALVGLPILALIMATIVALAWFVASVVQLVLRPAAPVSN